MKFMQSDKKYQEKMDTLKSIRSLPKITKKEFKQLIALSRGKESSVRWEVAEIIAEKEIRNFASKKLLLCLARDKDALVRIDAYEALQMFEIPEVELFLKRAIQAEKDDLACSYAIMAWEEIVLSIHGDHSDDKNYVEWLLMQRKIQESEHCMVECYCALYRFGESDIFPAIMSFAESENYQMHYVVYHILQEIVNEDNRLEIINALQKILENTYSMGFVKYALPYWKELIVEHTQAMITGGRY